jgi:uncharacterized membrane protein
MTPNERAGADPAGADPLRYHKALHKQHGTDSANVFCDSVMERVAEKVANGMGTVQFVIIGSLIILGWVFINGAATYIEHTVKSLAKGGEFDAEPWILLNLIFSGVAFYTGSLVIIAAKSEAKKSTAREEADALHREELNTKIVELIEANTRLTEADKALTEEVHAATCSGAHKPPAQSP